MFSIWDPLRTMEVFERDVYRTQAASYPALNVYAGTDDVVVTSEMPGIDPAHIDLSVLGDTLTIKGDRKHLDLGQDDTWHRRERGFGNFTRTLKLPYAVDGSKVEAKYEKGVLKIALPRAESDKPRKVTVRTTE